MPIWLQHLLWLVGQPEVLIPLVAAFLLGCGFVLIRWQSLIAPDFASRLFLISGLALFLLGVVLIARQAQPGIDHGYHDTYYVVASIEYALPQWLNWILGFLLYRYFHVLFGVPYRRWLSALHWAFALIGFLLVQLPVVWINMDSLPRRYVDYSETFAVFHAIALTGYIVTAISVAIFAIIIGEATYRRIRYGRAPQRPDDRPADHF